MTAELDAHALTEAFVIFLESNAAKANSMEGKFIVLADYIGQSLDTIDLTLAKTLIEGSLAGLLTELGFSEVADAYMGILAALDEAEDEQWPTF